MTKTFQLKNGDISFGLGNIKINDGAKGMKHLQLFASAVGSFSGFIQVYRYFKSEDLFLLWIGLFIGISHLMIFTFLLFLTHSHDVLIEDIKSIKVRKRLGNIFLDIKLKNNKLRRVNHIVNPEELDSYIKSIFEKESSEIQIK